MYTRQVEDTARVLGRIFDGIEFRGFKHKTVEDLAKYAGVPVWNGLTDAVSYTHLDVYKRQDEGQRNRRCEEILSIQAMGLKKRLAHTGCSHAVIGISGGLDSTLALLVTLSLIRIWCARRR